MNYYSFHIGDYASATRHLTWLEDAAYRRLLDVYYVKEEPLPADLRQVYRLVVASDDNQREAVNIVLDEFFTLTEFGYRHDRCDAEIHAANDKKNKASQSAKARWSNAKTNDVAIQSDNERNANAMRTHQNDNSNASETICEGNAPNPNPNPNKKQTTAMPSGFAEFWIAYPKKVGKGAAEAAWKKHRPPLQSCIDAIAIASRSFDWTKESGQYIPNPATWLNQRRWEDGASEIPINGKPLLPDFMRGAL